MFSDLFNNGAVGSCWPVSPGSLAGADSHYIINCLLLGVQQDATWPLERSLVLWEAAPSSCLQISFYKCVSLSWKRLFMVWCPCGCGHKHFSLKAGSLLSVLDLLCQCSTSPALCIMVQNPTVKGTLCLREQSGEAKAVASACAGETKAQGYCHMDTKAMEVQPASSHSISFS